MSTLTIKAPPEMMIRRPSKMKTALLEWMGVPISLIDGSFWAAYYGTTSESGEVVTKNSSLKLSAVWACVRLIAGTIATLPLNMYERMADGSRLEAKDHPLYELLHYQPNADQTAMQFWEVFLFSLLMQGNAFAEKSYLNDRLVALEFLLPERVTAKRTRDGSIEWKYIDPDTGKERVIPESRMFHVPAFSCDGIFGLSVIRYAVNIFGGAMSAEKAASSTFANGLKFPGVFEFDHVLKPNQREQFQQNVADQYAGAINAGRIPLLEAGIRYKQINMNPDDAQLLESRSFSVEEICRWFGVPPFMVGHGEKSSAWPTSIEQQMLAFASFVLRQWCVRIEQAVRKQLLRPEERKRFYAEFNMDALLRADSAARAQFYSTMTQNGLMARNEARIKENLAPKSGGDVLTVQTNLTDLAKFDKTEEAGATDVQQSAMNGAQVAALQALLTAVSEGKIPPETAEAAIAASFPLLTAAQISAMINPLKDFEPTPSEPAVVPGAKPPDEETPPEEEEEPA